MSLRVRVSPSALNVKRLLTVLTVGSFFIGRREIGEMGGEFDDFSQRIVSRSDN
ncbi:hypothetical protein [Microcoleus sp. bin38.metabat.b11b12b14.051]|uniref:hypothetical protein n=1 Tax=Microcoleus sp. bin38.metabat.b11b12b14.051 TaxID=2742709 RepID=UPI0025F88B89|nr:hypothetical protein [Microcoleus sp. bin38.metabat.b11b12b14.051]